MRPAGIDNDKYFSIQEAADYFGKSRDWINLRIERGMFTTLRHGRWTYVTKESARKLKESL